MELIPKKREFTFSNCHRQIDSLLKKSGLTIEIITFHKKNYLLLLPGFNKRFILIHNIENPGCIF